MLRDYETRVTNVNAIRVLMKEYTQLRSHQAARVIGMSIGKWYNLKREGLTPQAVENNGANLYDKQQILKLAESLKQGRLKELELLCNPDAWVLCEDNKSYYQLKK